LEAEAGSSKAETNLGLLYEVGQGVPQDYAKAAHWFRQVAHGYRLTANHGDAKAQFDLGDLYAFGWGVPQDYAKAAYWYRLAANQGLSQAQDILGDLYANGQGVPKDYVKSYKWLILAQKAGTTKTSNRIDQLMPLMTQDQIAEGQRLAREWRPVSKKRDLLKNIGAFSTGG